MTDDLQHWRDGLRPFDEPNQLILCALFATMGKPASLLDVGCGTGAVVRTARALGTEAVGVDQLVDESYGDGFIRHDLRQPLDLGRIFGMVTCIEVAEHLELDTTDALLDTLVRHVAPRGVLVFTAALPGQSGYGHVNCQFPEWWAHRLYARGLRQNNEATWRVALAWQLTPTQLRFLAANVQIWEKP